MSIVPVPPFARFYNVLMFWVRQIEDGYFKVLYIGTGGKEMGCIKRLDIFVFVFVLLWMDCFKPLKQFRMCWRFFHSG